MATNWGNYRDYGGSARHNPGSSPSVHVRDARLTALEALIPGLFKNKACLDIGCNAGIVSCQLAFDFQAASVVGIDIDAALIKQAKSTLQLRASRVRPDASSGEHANYFPVSALLDHGYRFEAEIQASGVGLPERSRVEFDCADFVLSPNPALHGPYDVVLALSVIKWIHLEHADEGLASFFVKCSSCVAAGGYLIIEVQPWDSYQKAVREAKSPHFRRSLDKLEYRPDTSFTELLEMQGLHLYTTCETLPREIRVYRKN